MIRLIDTVLSVLVYFFAAMAVGGLVIGVHLWFAWGLTTDRVREAIAMLRGEKAQFVEATPTSTSSQPPQEPSYQEIIAKRALAYRDWELKQKMLQALKEEMATKQTQLDKQEKLLAEREKTLTTKIAQFEQGVEDAGLETVRRTLESIRPSQAKELISDMLANNEEDQVVALLQEMNDSKRARIIGEFRTPDELAKISEVLRRLREAAELAGATE